MKNCLIMGSGRSGTSMVAGTVAAAGYHSGRQLHRARASNPYGFFEDVSVNDLNEELLQSVQKSDCTLGSGQRWLSIPGQAVKPDQPAEVSKRIDALLATRPFCLKDPRFCFTLPAWRNNLPEDTRLICIFRHPSLTATSIVRECLTTPYLEDVDVDLDRAFDVWSAMYRSVLKMADDDQWLFMHYDDMFEPSGLKRLGDHLDAPIDDALIDSDLRRHAGDIEAPAEETALYEELCDRAGHTDEASVKPAKERPQVDVVIPVMPGEEHLVEGTVRSLRDQRGVDVSVVVADATRSLTDLDGAAIVPVAVPSFGPAMARALQHLDIGGSSSDIVAVAIPGTVSLPNRLARAVRILEQQTNVDIVTCAHHLHDDYEQFTDVIHGSSVIDSPFALWEAGLVARRAAFAGLSTNAFGPAALQLLRQTRRADGDRVAHIPEPGFTASVNLAQKFEPRARNDARLADLAETPHTGRPAILVSLCTFNRRDVLAESIEAFARQELTPGTFEIVVTNDGSIDDTKELLEAIELDVPLRVIHQENKGLSAARNIGLLESTAEFVIFVNDDSIPALNCLERHLEAHAREEDDVAVLGTFEQPKEEMRNALTCYLEHSDKVFGYRALQSGQRYDGFRFMTCNVSVSLRAVRQVGAFDESFRQYGCEDTDLGLRLHAIGIDVVYDESARAIHRHVLSFDDFARRQRTVASAFVRLFRKHPYALNAWGNRGVTAEGCKEHLISFGTTGEIEARATKLAEVDLGSLPQTGDFQRTTQVLSSLAEAIEVLNGVWWADGYLAGFEQFAMDGFTDVDPSSGPWPVTATTVRHVLALPDWNDHDSLRTVMKLAQPLVDDSTLSLLLYSDPAHIESDTALKRLEVAFNEVFDRDVDLNITFEERTLTRPELSRVGTSVAAFLVTGTESNNTLCAIAAEPLSSADAVESWIKRFGGLGPDGRQAEIREPWLDTEGMIGEDEARLLFNLAQNVERGVIVEVGSYRGRSTAALAAGSTAGHGAPIYAIEPHEPFLGILGGEFGPNDRAAFMKTMLETHAYRNVRLVNLSSEVVTPGWHQPVGLLWIDGDHSYEGVRRDYESWAPHLLPGAVLAFDDATDPEIGPWRLLAELVESGDVEEMGAVGRVRTFQACSAAITLTDIGTVDDAARSAA